MYFQTLVGDTTRLLQGSARVCGGEPAWLAPAFNSILGGWAALGGFSASLRFSLGLAGEVSTTVFMTSPANRASELRLLFARLVLLDGVAGARVETPSDGAEFERFCNGWPVTTVSLDANLYTSAGTRLLCRGVWPDLVTPIATRMAALGAEFAAHVNITPASPSASLQKSWALPLVELDSQATPAALRLHQHAEFAAARQAAFNVETFWGTSPDMTSTLIASLDQAVHQREPALRQVGLHAVNPVTPEPVLEALHTLVLVGIDELSAASAAGFASQDEVALALSLPAIPTSPKKSGAPSDDGGRFGVRWNDMPPVLDRNGFCFISYAHADADAVYKILRLLRDRNIPYWYDHGIPAGEQWDDALEEKLSSCSAVVAFLSPRSVHSRYCRREIKYADILGKPILPVMLESTRLEGGMSFILSHIQFTDAGDPLLVDRLAATIDGLR